MALGDNFYKKIQEKNPYEEIIDEQDIPLAPGVSYKDLESVPLMDEAQEQNKEQTVADALANDLVAKESLPNEIEEQRDDVQEELMSPGVVESGQVSQEDFDKARGNATPEEALLQEIRLAREGRNKKLEEAATRDKYTNLMNSLNQAFSQMDAGTAMKASKVPNIKAIEGMKLDANEQERQAKLGQMPINDLLEEYNLLRRGTLSEKDKAYLGLQKEGMDRADQRSEANRLLREKAMERSQGKKEEAQQRAFNKDIYGIVKDFEKDDLNKELKKQGLAFEQADDLIKQIESGNEIALGALGTKMARAMGEVGVLTDADVERYVQSQSIIQKLKDKYGKSFKGQIPQETLKSLQEVTNKMKSGFLKTRANVIDKYVDYAYRNFGVPNDIPLEKIQERFGIKPQTPSKVEVTLPNGQKGRIDRDKLDAFKKKYPDAQVLE